MTEALKKIIELKMETENVIERISINYIEKAEEIREQCTIDMWSVVNTIEDMYKIAKQYELTECGGFYRLRTPIDSVVYQGYKVGVILYANRPFTFKIDAKKQTGDMIGHMGYSGEWGISKANKFPLDMGDGLTNYSKEVLNLIRHWEEYYSEIENGLIADCNNVLTCAMRKVNKLL